MSKRFNKSYLLAAIVLVAILIGVAVAIELFSYTATVTIQPIQQLSQGASSSSWSIYINQEDQTQYVPGANSEPTFDQSNTGTYAFNVTTDANKVCAVEINLETAMSSSDFSSFQITVLYWDGTEWSPATLYNAATGSTTIPYIDGTTSTSGYIHQAISTSTYYLVAITYSYLAETTSPYTVNLQYTAIPLSSF